ncbi:hypothetical protein [Sandarakinorhabdus sp.]|uniref:hypothetical protein n=1 Tax=Sandarakinorhabdus sp. TaxID=1916663 RepID=UPI00286E79C2|nr:hypothetical protein [Sandarakinorhabdus sp.]
MQEASTIKPPKVIEIAARLGISQPYASMLVNGRRPWPVPLAARAWQRLGLKYGPLVDLDDAACAALARAHGAPASAVQN